MALSIIALQHEVSAPYSNDTTDEDDPLFF